MRFLTNLLFVHQYRDDIHLRGWLINQPTNQLFQLSDYFELNVFKILEVLFATFDFQLLQWPQQAVLNSG